MTSTSSTSSIFDHTAGNRFFPELLGSTNKGANEIISTADKDLRQLAETLSQDNYLPETVTNLAENFEEVAGSDVSIDDYFQKLNQQLKTGIENLYKIFNFFSNYSTQLNLNAETKEKIDKILKPAI